MSFIGEKYFSVKKDLEDGLHKVYEHPQGRARLHDLSAPRKKPEVNNSDELCYLIKLETYPPHISISVDPATPRQERLIERNKVKLTRLLEEISKNHELIPGSGIRDTKTRMWRKLSNSYYYYLKPDYAKFRVFDNEPVAN